MTRLAGGDLKWALATYDLINSFKEVRIVEHCFSLKINE